MRTSCVNIAYSREGICQRAQGKGESEEKLFFWRITDHKSVMSLGSRHENFYQNPGRIRIEKECSLFREQRRDYRVSKSPDDNSEIGVSIRPGKVLSSHVGKN